MKAKPKTSSNKNSEQSNQSSIETSKKEDPKVQLMSRLARGEKSEISKKDMLKLTSKNYELLPEVKKKKEEERKKQELRERMKKAKEIGRQISEISKGRR